MEGTGWAVAVLDTGVDKVHPFLTGKVVEEACFSGNSNCPNGSPTQLGPGAGVPCIYAPNGCRHGTHVAGIAAGRGSSFSGVARGADLIAIQVFSSFTGTNNCGTGEDPCPLSFASDQIAGLERVFTLRTSRQIAAANMSLGGGKFLDQASCDAENVARKAAIDNLRSVGIATVIASGNDGFHDGLNAPACISSAVSVGSTTKTDQVSSFSNSASFLSLLAPGSSINSSVPGGDFAFFNGTSMAAPHVAGAWAILKQRAPTATVAAVLNALRSTGLPVTDTRSHNLTTPRIRIFRALNALGSSLFCNIQLNQTTFVDTNTVIATIQVRNDGAVEVPIEVKIWLDVAPPPPPAPPIPPHSIINVGADGSVSLRPGFTTGPAPVDLFQFRVEPGFPRGQYGFGCRIIHPVTGRLITEDLNPFTIQ